MNVQTTLTDKGKNQVRELSQSIYRHIPNVKQSKEAIRK